MQAIKTGAWSTIVPSDHIKIGISRGSPRGHAKGYRLYKALAPGPWFHSVEVDEFVKLYNDSLAALDPRAVVDDIARLAEGRTPVLTCFEPTEGIADGSCWCHRSLAAHWLHTTLGVTVSELDAPPDFNPMRHFLPHI